MHDEQSFDWFNHDHDSTDDWVASLSASFNARTGLDPNRDCPVYEVEWEKYPTSANPSFAFTEIDYTFDDQLRRNSRFPGKGTSR